ncbi:hypothetical protein [Maricaulis sp.]|jgi:membrane-associated PAP2 superfamily phosphatase|uniref:hypothetical protein n=1 Tax=Maricaulis sp. TaxID=1486257 RepID=UPI002606CB54|nr:hypothetical protein [Maricaulis sp.]MDF1768924.1 hypothetical protein [Maricaulis sp.]
MPGFLESTTRAVALGTVLALGWYLLRVVPQIFNQPLDEISWKIEMVISLVVFIATLIADIIRAAIANRGELDQAGVVDDERDHVAERRGDAWGGHAMHAAAFVALMLLVFEFDPFWAANTLFVGAMLAGLVSSLVKLLTYRGSV